MDTIYLLPGEERCVDFRDANGIPKVHYTYCSIRGKLFNCTCCTKDEAQRLCEEWLVKQDRCYINLRSENVLLHSFLSASKVFLDGRHKDIHIDRLCDMVVHPGIQCRLFIFGEGICSHSDDGDACLLTAS